MDILKLDGAWTLLNTRKNIKVDAIVPGCVHTDLLRNNIIEDPFYRDNEKKQMWVGESEWVYSREFEINQSFWDSNSLIYLECDGIDTLADIYINDALLASTDNQFRSYSFDIKKQLKVGKNAIKIVFHSAIDYITKKQKEKFLWHTGLGAGPEMHRISGGNQIRKSQCNFGWDWGPMCVTAGIWKTIKIVGYNDPKINYLQVSQKLQNDYKTADITIEIETIFDDLAKKDLYFDITILHNNTQVLTSTSPFSAKKLTMTISNPNLWWPNDLGEQHLYTVVVTLRDAVNTTVSEYSRRIGIRELRLEQKKDEYGQTFQFVANGQSFFAKGVNWIPADVFVSQITNEKYDYLLQQAKDAHMNMLRIWGGGIYENDYFYDRCDELGICIWQDYMFACSAYPAHDDSFLANVKQEATEQTKRLHHHASMALWCGNNEIEDFWDTTIGDEEGKMTLEDYKKLFDDILPSIVKQYSPQIDYIPSSGHSPYGERKNTINIECGDAHLWDVWFYREPFEWYRTSNHRFCSEFGFQSFPQLNTVETYTLAEDRNITSYIMEHHQKSTIGNEAIIQYMCRWFKLPKNFEMMLWLSQIQQGIAVKYGVDHWRRNMPRSMGALYWQLNDCWPGPSWSSIDSQGNLKALQYMARKFFQPISLSLLENKDITIFEVFVSNDTLEKKQGILHYSLLHVDGTTVFKKQVPVTIVPTASTKVYTIELTPELKNIDIRDVFLYCELEVDNTLTSTDIGFLIKPKHMGLQDPVIDYSIKVVSDNEFKLTITAEKPALWVWLSTKDIQMTFSDAFFAMIPGKMYEVTITTKVKTSEESIRNSIKVYSLFNTY